jgi:hypothetical protein
MVRLLLWIALFILYIILNTKKGKKESTLKEKENLAEETEYSILDEIEDEELNDNIEYLKKTIKEDMKISDIVSTFEKICNLSNEGEMILFETGTYSFTGEPLFYFSLVKQVPNNEEEYFQVHVDVLYKPDSENEILSDSVWNEDIDENIFEFIRKSDAFKYAENNNYISIEIYLDET